MFTDGWGKLLSYGSCALGNVRRIDDAVVVRGDQLLGHHHPQPRRVECFIADSPGQFMNRQPKCEVGVHG